MKFLRSQPTAVWAVAAAAVVPFMGLGLVGPILPAIARDLRASPSDVELLFTGYFAFTGLSMLFSGVVAGRIGTRRTLLAGLAPIVVFSASAGLSNSVGAIVGLRAGWGLGNAHGAISWRGPFFGVGVPIAIGFIAIAMFLPRTPPPSRDARVSVLEPLRALRHRATRGSGLTAVFHGFEVAMTVTVDQCCAAARCALAAPAPRHAAAQCPAAPILLRQ